MVLDGATLTLDALERIAAGEPVELSPASRERIAASRNVVERMASGDEPVYAVNTGVGLLADVRIKPEQIALMQRNLIRSHSCGVGEPLKRQQVRAMMAARVNLFALGLSGVRPLIAETLCQLLNRAVTPLVPSRGSVGASGDLAPLSHMAAVLIGEGEAEFDGPILPGAEALRRAGIAPVVLVAKEAVSLINGTQAMVSVGGLAIAQAQRLARWADLLCAMTVDALKGTPEAFDPRIHDARPQPGQRESAARILAALEGSEIRESHRDCPRVQDAYSLRCAPQVHGAIATALDRATRIFDTELNSATDNPLVFGNEILSGGNFHGQPIALEMDYLAIALAALAGISERRIDRVLNPALNEDLPPFLAADPGLESGYMMAQITAAALVAELRVLATPATPGSITTDGNKEDFVSMGMTAALKLEDSVEHTARVLAIEALSAERALELRAPLRSSPVIEAARSTIRRAAETGAGDRTLTPEIERLAAHLRHHNPA
ncbi:MAG: histidine ammonia-lyase [Acidimicrobiia bacterium]|nr:histidine ammonia-lyase [Acidimicrobiia bacterium]